MPFKKKHQTALTVLSIIMILVLLLYTARIYSNQIVKASEYSSLANGSTSVRKAVLKAPRGEILDRYGRQIAVNRDGYNIVFNKAYVGDALNDIILCLVNLLDNSGTEHTDKLPMEYSAPYAFKEDESNAKLKKV